MLYVDCYRKSRGSHRGFPERQKKGAAIRVFLNVECSVPILGMTLDDANTDADEVISTGGTTFIVKKSFSIR
jgi:Fe-S cluster assembly iron-binding protein IscA